MAESLKKLRIFAASPSDVASERAKLETVVKSLKPMADYLGLTLEVVDWHAVVPDAGRPQQIIFNQLNPTSWDIFIGILWHRFGAPPGAKDKTGKEYLSGTEEEFEIAYELWKQYSKPRIVVYRCTRALPFDVDPDQLKRVRKFFKLMEEAKGDHPTLYQIFDTTKSFEKLLLDNLQKLLIEYSKQSKIVLTPEVVEVLAPRIPNNLPRRAAFFGRTNEMDKVMRALSPGDRTWGVLLDGIGGIGKTSLAIEAAYRVQEAAEFDNFIFITAKQNVLEPVGIREKIPAARTLDEFLSETARILGQVGILKLSNQAMHRALLDVLRIQRALLIYDNLETLTKDEQEKLADFLRELPQGCKAIITSRRRGGEGAVWLRLGKLDWEAAYCIIENEVSRDAVLANKLRRTESRWYELYDETNGSPLALVHTLGLLRVRTALSFDGALAMLRGVQRKNNLVKFVYQEAHKELTENDKKALRALSFFNPSATFDAWMQVAGLSRNALETTIDRLNALSLVDTLTGQENYSLHPLTRSYIHEDLLTDKRVVNQLERAFANYWINYVFQRSDNKHDSFKQLEDAWLNIRITGDWLLQKTGLRNGKVKDEDMAMLFLSLVSILDEYLWLSGRWDENKQMNSEAYSLAIALHDRDSAGKSAYNVAWIDGIYGRNLPHKAKPWIDKCSRVWSKSEDVIWQKEVVRLRGLTAVQLRRFKDASTLLKKALSLSRKIKSKYSVMIILNDLGRLAFEQEKMSEAKKFYQRALKIANEIKSKEGKAFSSVNLGDVVLKQGQIIIAHKVFKSALPLAQRVGRVDLVARVKHGLAIVWESKNRDEKALSLAKDGLELFQKLQHPNKIDAQELVDRLEKKIRLRDKEKN
jgi:tetratricopeptide (TPR) repeat protein